MLLLSAGEVFKYQLYVLSVAAFVGNSGGKDSMHAVGCMPVG